MLILTSWMYFVPSLGGLVLLVLLALFIRLVVRLDPRRVSRDSLGTVARYLDRLLLGEKITLEEYRRFRQLLDDDYVRAGSVPPPRLVIPGHLPPSSRARRPSASPAMPVDTRSPVPLPEPVPTKPPPGALETRRPLAVQPADPMASAPPPVRSRSPSRALESSGPSLSAPWDDLPGQPARPVRTPWSEMLQGFMRENNIRWGELLSGLLIVGSAVGLVVSLRHELRETVPYFPALLFMLVTAAIHGVGAYTLKKWKLPSTSRGILLIGLLLVPLNLFTTCLLMDQSDRVSVATPVFWSSLIVGSGVFATLTYASSAMLFRSPMHWFVTVCVVGCSLWQLPLHYGVTASTDPWTVQLFSLPLAVLFLVGTGGALRSARRLPLDTLSKAELGLMMWGLSSFAFASASVMLAHSRQDLRTVLVDASGSLLPALGLGWMVTGAWLNRYADRRGWQMITGLAILVTGLTLMLAAPVAAWPAGPRVLIAMVLAATASFVVSQRMRLPWLHWVALAQAAVAWVVAWQMTLGLTGIVAFRPPGIAPTELTWSLWISPWTAAGLTAYAMILGMVAHGWTTRVSAGAHSAGVRRIYQAAVISTLTAAGLAIVGGVLGATGIELGTAAAVLLLNSIVVLMAGGLAERRQYLRLGAGLLLIGFGFAVQSYPGAWPLWELGGQLMPRRLAVVGLFVSCTLLSAVPLALVGRRFVTVGDARQRLHLVAVELSAAALVVAVVAAVTVLPLGAGSAGWFAVGLAAVSLSAGVLWWLTRRMDIYWFLQLSLLATAMVTATATWFEYDDQAAWQSPFHAGLQLVVVSGLLLSTNLVHAIRGRRQVRGSVDPIACERTLGLILAATLFALSTLACLPGIAAELGATWRDADSYPWLVQLRYEPLLWWGWAAMFTASLLGFRAVDRRLYGSAVLLAVAAGLLQLAAQFAPSASTASAIRWFTTSALLAGLSGCLWIQRTRHLGRSFPAEHGGADNAARREYREWLWVGVGLGGIPTLILMFVCALRGGMGHQLAGPNEPWFFGRLSVEVNYGVPLLIGLASTLVAAWHERERWFARAGFIGLMVLVGVWLLAGLYMPRVANRADWIIHYSYAGAMILAVFAWGWIPLERRLWNESAPLDSSPWLQTLLAAVLGTALVPPLAGLFLVLFPLVPWDEFVIWVARPTGWLALGLAGSLVVPRFTAERQRLSEAVLQAMVLALLGLIGTTTAAVWPLDPSVTYRVIITGLLAVAAGWLAWGSLDLPSPKANRWSLAAGRGQWVGAWTAMSLVGALVACWWLADVSNQPAAWLLPSLLLVLVLATWGVRVAAETLAHLGAVAILGVVSFLASHPSMRGLGLSEGAWPHLTAAALAAYAALVLMVEPHAAQSEARGTTLPGPWRFPPLARWIFVILYTCGLFADFMAGMAVGAEAGPRPTSQTFLQGSWGWPALASIGLLVTGSLWDSRQRGRLALLYVWGFLVACFLTVPFWSGERLFVAILLTVSAYHSLVGWLLRQIPKLTRGHGAAWLGDAAPLPARAIQHGTRIVMAVTLLVSLLALLPVLTLEDRSGRVASAFVPALAAMAWGLTVPLLDSTRARRAASGTVLLFSLACLSIALADVTPGIWEPVWLRRLLRIVIVSAWLTALYGGAVSRLLWLGEVWRRAMASATKRMAGTAAASLLLLVLVEIGMWQAGIPLGLTVQEAAAVAVALLAMMVGLVVAALAPGQLRLQVSESTRETFVYLAEGIGGLLGIHVMLAMPWLIQPAWRPFWPYALMALAFAGVGASEVCRRRGWEILSRPLLRTGTLLPLVPFLAMWLVPAAGDYALVLVLGGLLYFVTGAARTNPTYAAVGVACGNLALWTFLQRTEAFAFFRHPQIWLIPPALSVLVALQLAPRALSTNQKSLVRYLCVLVIYVSSTSEIFITGLGDALWPPMVLIVLSLLGVMLGIGLRIRAFLALGTVFVFISLLSMVMHAQRSLDHVWPWWAFGIGLGMGILVLLGLFEKKRPELLVLLQRLKQWEG